MVGKLLQPGDKSVILERRYLETDLPGFTMETSLSWGVDQAVLTPLSIASPCYVDRLIVKIYTTSAGNVRMALYREGGTIDLPDGGALIVETASIAAAGVNVVMLLPIISTYLRPGRYWVAIQHDDATLNLFAGRMPAGGLQTRRFDQAYGAFPNPCPATIVFAYNVKFWLRVERNLPAF